MKVRYTYTVYKDFPEATEISKLREARKFPYLMLASALLIVIVLLSLVEIKKWSGVLILVVALSSYALFLLYLFRHYDKVTEKKIRLSMEQTISTRNRMNDFRSNLFKYQIDGITRSRLYTEGKCTICSNVDYRLERCEVDSSVGTIVVNLCDDCVKKVEESISRN